MIFAIINGCSSTNQNNNNLVQVVEDYYSVYSQRNDFERLMTFYADNAQFEDIIYGNSFNNKIEIKNFLAWNKGEFKALSGESILTVTKQVVQQNTAITEGYFHKFSYDGQKLGPWLFVIIQEFNTNHKIIKQTDWINYTPRNNFLGGKNMNEQLRK
jgi:hypothetical protein